MKLRYGLVVRSIALFGPMGSGKSTIADILVSDYGYAIKRNAGNLKDIAAKVYGGGNPIEKGSDYTITDPETGLPKVVSGRQVLQGVGEVMKHFDKHLWIRWLTSEMKDYLEVMHFVVDDGRFPFEADAFREMGFLIVRVEVPYYVRAERLRQLYGRYPTQGELYHETETQLDDIEYDRVVLGTASPYKIASGLILAAQGGP